MRPLRRTPFQLNAPAPAFARIAPRCTSALECSSVHVAPPQRLRQRGWRLPSSSSSSYSCAALLSIRTYCTSSPLLKASNKSERQDNAPAGESHTGAEKKAAAAATPARSTDKADGKAKEASTGKAAGRGSKSAPAKPAAEATPTPATAKQPKREEKAKKKEAAPEVRDEASLSASASASASSFAEAAAAASAEARLRDERFRDAETTLRVEEVFARDTYQRFIHTTEVSTVEGLRWLDVTASPAFFADPLMARVPEGQFAYAVMRKLFGSRFPIGVYASVASGLALPATYVDENWACLILRSTKERPEGQESPQQRNAAGPHHSPADYDVDRATMSSGNMSDYAYDETMNEFYPKQLRVSQQWMRRLRRRWEKEEALKNGTAATSPGASSGRSDAAAAAASMRRRHGNPGAAASGRSSSSRYRSPLTMSEFTDRLTIFIGKELHPVEKDPHAPGQAAPAPASGEAPVLSLDVDRTYASPKGREPPAAAAAGTNTTTATATSSAADARAHYEVRWRVITVHRSPITFIREMQSQWNKLTSRNGRVMRTMRTVPAHNHPAVDGEDAIKQALRRAARPAYMTEEEDEEDDYGDAANTTVDRVEDWEDLVRLLYHGAARTLQESAYRNTRRLEVMETEIFDATEGSAQHLHSMTRLMAELHLLSREATLHNAILRESKVAYQKLKRVLDRQVGHADQRELLYVDSVLSISSHLEEQSESLLFLQFSVAMNQTEQHLRTLTIFNTIFIPLEFICSCCGSDIFTSGKLSHSKGAMYAVFGLMGATTVVTMRWIRRNLR